MNKIYASLVFIFIVSQYLQAQSVVVDVNVLQDNKAVSPYIYGKNNCFSDNPSSPTSSTNIKLYKEAGLRFVRENSGNNATKYNWRRKLCSHPDWYNNVYDHDWDYEAQSILENLPHMQIMYAFQLIGKVAANKNHNFNDWSYNNSQWWSGTGQNLAGGGVINPDGGSEALQDGDPDLYLMDWNADSSAAILDHWFGMDGLGFSKANFRYWNMDNEPEIWSGTHDDCVKEQPSPEAFIQNWVDYAKKAREKYPDIKITGPVTCNEWQWFRYSDVQIKVDGLYYPWLEYFIMKIAEAQKESGIRLLDVLDLHWYPSENKASDLVQMHRFFYDTNYDYPGANGLKTINGGWDNAQTKEYIFKRINDWLDEYFGEGHGITLGLSENDFNTSDPNVLSVLYGSILGTFANNGVEYYTPWNWHAGMWETLHLYSRYAKNTSVQTTSGLEERISGYTTINENSDSMTLMLVNRDLSYDREVTVNLHDYAVNDGTFQTLQLANLPSNETFKSHTNNALKSSSVEVSNNSFTLSLPPLSTTAVLLTGMRTGVTDLSQGQNGSDSFKVYTDPNTGMITLAFKTDRPLVSIVKVYNNSGKLYQGIQWKDSGQSRLTLNTSGYPSGLYIVEVQNSIFCQKRKLVIK